MLTSPLLEAKTYISCKQLQTLFSVPVGCWAEDQAAKELLSHPEGWSDGGYLQFHPSSVEELACFVWSFSWRSECLMPKTLLCTR